MYRHVRKSIEKHRKGINKKVNCFILNSLTLCLHLLWQLYSLLILQKLFKGWNLTGKKIIPFLHVCVGVRQIFTCMSMYGIKTDLHNYVPVYVNKKFLNATYVMSIDWIGFLPIMLFLWRINKWFLPL